MPKHVATTSAAKIGGKLSSFSSSCSSSSSSPASSSSSTSSSSSSSSSVSLPMSSIAGGSITTSKNKIIGSVSSSLSMNAHCAIAFGLRLVLVIYSGYHDRHFNVPYTDVDYKVYTDAARHLSHGRSPYDRHTYRYTPLLALLMLPNVYLHRDCGKLIFSLVDVLVARLTRKIIAGQGHGSRGADLCALLWLYNPLALVISTRGNADSLAVYLVLWTLHLLRTDRLVLAGLLHGLSIHFRLYPLAFSLAMYLHLQNSRGSLLPSRRQWRLVLACALALTDLTALGYALYGRRFLDESLVYHLVRRDVRHNFSVFFYMLYLTAADGLDLTQKFFTLLPQVAILVALAFRYSSSRQLPFALFAQAITMVTFNPVVTSQYFFWFLSLLPVCLPQLRMSLSRAFGLLVAWILSQSLWLAAAYQLEFRGIDSFDYIWAAGIIFFAVNIKILVDLIRAYEL